MTKTLRRRHDPAAPDDGAAAVEFALLFPIFALLTFGMLSGGLVLWHTISTTQASRDAGRLGSTTTISTLAMPPADGSKGLAIEDWLKRNLYVALQSSGWSPPSEVGVLSTNMNDANERGYACVAYVKGSVGGSLTDKRLAIGTGTPAPAGVVEDGRCFADSSTLLSSRVQVLIQRKEQWNMIVAAPTWTVSAKANVPYERNLP